MRIIFRIITGFLSSFVIIFVILLAIPITRNLIFDEIAKNSNYYKTQIEHYQTLEDEYNENLNSLAEIQQKYDEAESKIELYQTQLNEKSTDIELLKQQIDATNLKCDEANLTIIDLNAELETLNQQYTDLNAQLDNEIANNSQNQELIDALNSHISILESDIESNQNLIQQLNSDIDTYIQEIENYNQIIVDYEQQIESLMRQIEEQERIIYDLQHNLGIDLGFTVSFDDYNVSIVNSLGEEKIYFELNGENIVSLDSLKGVDVYSLTVDYLIGNCSVDNSINSTSLGEVTINPEACDISWYLWDPVNQIYIGFTDDNIKYLISLGYTNVGYDLYTVDYTDGVLSFHINFNNFS